MYNLFSNGCVEGISLNNTWGDKYSLISDLDNIRITQKGIQYILDNSYIDKAQDLLKDAKGIIPFV